MVVLDFEKILVFFFIECSDLKKVYFLSVKRNLNIILDIRVFLGLLRISSREFNK